MNIKQGSTVYSTKTHEIPSRRPCRVREYGLMGAAAGRLVRIGVRPNQISILSLVFAGMGGTCFIFAGHNYWGLSITFYLAAAAFIILRGLCNILDGILAIEGGLKTKSGEIFNELPDRLSDPLLLICAGYSIIEEGWVDLGWAAGILAVITAYVRTLGRAAGASQHFCGPMAKEHRMTILALASIIAAAETALGIFPRAIIYALVIVTVGCVITIARRICLILRELESKNVG
jgi:phosphatidylglycerophosphate synthase